MRPGRWLKSRRRRRPGSSCRWWCRRGCAPARWRYPNVINVFFVLSRVRVEIKRRGIRHIASGIIRNDGDVIAYLVLLWIALERIKGVAHGDVRRPCDAAIRAERIKQLGIGVIGSVSCVQPHRIDPSIGGYRQCTKPVPLVMIDWVIINPMRRAKSQSTGAVHCQERLARQAAWINCIAEIEAAAKTDLSDSVKSGRDCRVLRIAGAKAPKWAGKVGRATDKEIAVCIHVQRSPDRRARKKDWIHPGGPAVGGAAELPTTPIVARGAPNLILEPVTCAVGPVYGEPFLVTSAHITKC